MDFVEGDEDIEPIRALAIKKGAKETRLISPSSVITGEWVRLKCQYGCGGYNQCLTCPPYSPSPAVTRKLVDEYSKIILAHLPTGWRHLREIMASLEREVFLFGLHKALAFGSGPCHLCEPCPRQYPCTHPDEARPSMEACGIDVFTTARNAGFPIEVLRSRDCKANFYGLLLVD